MKVNIKVISSFENSFYIKVEDTITVKELKEKISQKIKNNKFNLIRDGGILHDSIDLNTYEFCEFDCVELKYN